MKKGFTLVELLAVIVILSVIAIITVPIIGNVIEESKKKALEQSAYGLLEAANYLALKSNELEHFTFTSNGVESITKNKLDYKGKIDAVGDLYIDEEGDISLCLYNDKYYVYKSYKMNDKVVIGEKKDNQTCIIGKNLITNKYVAYAGEKGSSVNDNYYDKSEVDKKFEDLMAVMSDMQDTIDILSDTKTSFLKSHPVGSIYITVSEEENTVEKMINKYGGNWVAWGTGRVPVGFNASDASFDTIEETGGEKAHTLTVAELASHNHGVGTLTTENAGNHWHYVNFSYTTSDSGIASGGSFYWPIYGPRASRDNGLTTTENGAHNHSISGNSAAQGSGTAHNNLQPYITCYMWKRI